MRSINSPALLLAMIMAISGTGAAQERCFTPAEAAKVAASIQTPSTPQDVQKVRKEFLEMRKQYEKLREAILADFTKNESRVPELNELSRAHLVRVCEIIRQDGWLSKAVLKEGAFDALLFILTYTRAADLENQMMPVLIAASKTGDMPKPVLAQLVDTIRLGAGLAQIFGTQATRKGDVIYISPLLSDEKVDEWRRSYELPPLANEIRLLEVRYLLPVLKTQRLSTPGGRRTGGAADVRALGITDADETITIETKLVDLNVSVQPPKGGPPLTSELAKDDFAVFEDGVQQDVSFFSSADSPFDMVLVLDFSGSTADKRSLIKKAAKRFVEVARGDDKIAVIAFADEIKLAAGLTSDKKMLYDSIDRIKVEGRSPVWDSLVFVYDNVIKKDHGRRTAVVFMTDGGDNASKTTFADLMEIVRHADTTIFPIYLNTLGVKESQKDFLGKLGTKFHQSLTMLSDETGGQSYTANDLKDLNGIYEQVVNDIGKIYTLGYEPKNESRDGGWRKVEVKLTRPPGLSAKTRRGYYAN